MTQEQKELFIKVHNELLKRKRIQADKYEREDSCYGAMIDVEKGQDMQEALIEAFKNVYGVEISDALYKSCYALCVGPKIMVNGGCLK